MPNFKLSPESFGAVKKRIIVRTVIFYSICIPVGLYIGGRQGKVDESTNAVISVALFLFITAVLFYRISRSLKYAKERYLSWTLIIEGSVITRLQQNTPSVSFYFREVTSISRSAKGDLLIKGTKRGDVIYIPNSAEGFAEIENTLQNIQPIAEKAVVPFMQKYNLLLSALMLVMMVCVYTVSNKVIVGISGTAITGVMIWGLYDAQTNKNIDRKTKMNSLYFLIVIGSVIVVTVIKLRM